ncbi:MAG: hypothetical protein U1F43_29090 [Myxococcota bacterium]
MSARELIAKVAARPLRPVPLADVQARLAKLGNQVADPFHTLLGKVALHETAGLQWNDWTLAAKPTLKPGAISLGSLGDGSQVWHSLTTNPLGRTTASSFGEERFLGELSQFLKVAPEP